VTATRPRRIFLVGYYGMHNLGDEAIRTAIEAAAPAFDADISAFASRDPSAPEARAIPIRGLGLWRYLRAIGASDRVVLGGGGILKDEGLALPLELFATAFAARLMRRDVRLLAVGVGPFYSRLGRWLAMVTARLATVRTVRDAASLTALRELGVGRAELGADPTFSMTATDAADAVTGGGPRRVVVSLRPWFLKDPDGGTERQTRLREAVVGALAPLAAAGWRIEMLNLYWPRDRAEAALVAADPRLAGAVIVERELDWAALTELLRGADLVVAMRYHAVAAAASLGLPTIALAYEPKVASLASELGLPGLPVDDPGLGATLAERVAKAADRPTSAAPDPEALAALRARAWLALRRALGPAGDEG
jgi:polysaccharide pyruvyl transferase CsaB